MQEIEATYKSGSNISTIIDVARVSGVSVSTVSRVLNGKADVSKSTRLKVQQAIVKMGFAPQVTARRLVTQQSRTLSLLFPAVHTALTSLDLDFVIGAATAAGERDYFFNMLTDNPGEQRILEMYRSRLIDGMILMQILLDDWRVKLLKEQRLPFVMVGRPADLTGLSYIDFDFEGAVRSMFDFLVMQGHYHIAFIGRPQAQITSSLGSAVRAQKGYELAVEQHNLKQIVINTDLNPLATAQATYFLLDSYPSLTAIVTTNGPSTMGVLNALRSRNKRVPDEISVIGIATPKVAEMMTPALTAASFPSAELGYQAASMLVRQLSSNYNQVEQIVIPVTISVRSTTAPQEKRN